jgi:hypothetical protein
MTKLFYASWILIFVCSCKQSKFSCKKFKTGRFISHSADDQYTIIERNDTIQIETNKVTGHVFKSKIKWTSDCENQLSDVEEAKDSLDSLKPIWIGKIVTTKILKVEKDYCVYESSMTGVSMRMIDTLYILK